MWFYHLQSLGSCGLASQLSANIFWASSGCLKLQKLDSFEKITKKPESTEIPPLFSQLRDIESRGNPTHRPRYSTSVRGYSEVKRF